MISQKSGFKLVDRGFKETVLLIPGWAMDYRIFNSLDLDFNYLMPGPLSLTGFEAALLASLKEESLEKISILGFSMGGFLAADFASGYPQKIKDLTLIGMRKRYDKDDIEKIKGYIANNKAGYLYKFYHECFSSGEQKELSIFKKGLMKDYLEEMTVDALIAGLDYLKSAELDTGKLKTVKTRFIHGEDDSIAPIEGVLALKNELPGSKLVILRNVGHIPFLRSDFKAFYGRQDI